MHWSEEIADEIIKRSPDKEEYVCAAGISPSGSIHIGNFRDIATSYFVCKALRKKGKKARLLFSWDEFDRFRKVPVNVVELGVGLEAEIGKPYSDIPDPFGCCGSYALHFEQEFETSLARFGIAVDFRRQAGEYRSGRYTEYIIQALEKRGQIFDILAGFRTQEAEEGERENYYPVSIYCPECGKDDTVISTISPDCSQAHFKCKCGHEGDFDFKQDYNCKLAWKIDWPMRWLVEGVDFEPGGKDHASPTGSYQTSRIISEQIFNYPAPLFQGYEFIGIKGTTGKMSGSSGLNLTPAALLKLYQPEVILWLYSKTEPTKAFNFCFDDEILRQYFEFDKMYNEYREGKASEYHEGIMYNAAIEGRELKTVSMQQLVSFGSIVDFNLPILTTIFEKIGTPYQEEDFIERLELARYWLEQCSPQSVNRLCSGRNWPYYQGLSADEVKEIQLLHEFLNSASYDLDSLNSFLYSVPEQVYGEIDDKTRKAKQGQFFKNVYQLLLDRPKGPRLYLFLYAIDKEKFIHLLDFSQPQTEAEKALAEVLEVDSPEASGPVASFKDEVLLEDFQKLDLRVCKVVDCEDVKKSRSFLKLTLSDGIGQRVIISGIKQEYQPQELIGRKIIVLANLKPAKFSGISSQGMLLAGTAESCGCKIIFVDDSIPEGTALA